MDKKYAFIDFEMDVNCDSNPEQIISVGLIITNNKGKILRKYKSYSKIINKKHIYEYTTFITGIKNSDIVMAKSFKDNIDKIYYLTKDIENIFVWGNKDKKCVRYTTNLNANNIKSKYNRFLFNKKSKELQTKIIDYRECLPKKYRKNIWSNLYEFAKELNIIDKEEIQEHSAIEDAKMLSKIYFKTKEGDING